MHRDALHPAGAAPSIRNAEPARCRLPFERAPRCNGGFASSRCECAACRNSLPQSGSPNGKATSRRGSKQHGGNNPARQNHPCGLSEPYGGRDLSGALAACQTCVVEPPPLECRHRRPGEVAGGQPIFPANLAGLLELARTSPGRRCPTLSGGGCNDRTSGKALERRKGLSLHRVPISARMICLPDYFAVLFGSAFSTVAFPFAIRIAASYCDMPRIRTRHRREPPCSVVALERQAATARLGIRIEGAAPAG